MVLPVVDQSGGEVDIRTGAQREATESPRHGCCNDSEAVTQP
jgi:hypothetical protein